MPSNLCVPVFNQADEWTGHCTGAVGGKRFVKISASPSGGMLGTENIQIIQNDTAGARTAGVARYDGVAGDEVPVLSANHILPLVAGAAITAGLPLMSDNQGRAVPWTTGNNVVAIACEDQATVGSDVVCRLVG